MIVGFRSRFQIECNVGVVMQYTNITNRNLGVICTKMFIGVDPQDKLCFRGNMCDVCFRIFGVTYAVWFLGKTWKTALVSG